MNRFAGRPSAGLIVAMIALVLALAGSAVALPGKGSVDKNDLAKGSVTKKAIKKGAVTKKAIGKAAVTSAALADASVGATKLKAIAQRTATATVADGTYGEATATCQAGETLISGGATVENAALAAFTPLMESGPAGNGWNARILNGSGQGNQTLTAYALCLAN